MLIIEVQEENNQKGIHKATIWDQIKTT